VSGDRALRTASSPSHPPTRLTIGPESLDDTFAIGDVFDGPCRPLLLRVQCAALWRTMGIASREGMNVQWLDGESGMIDAHVHFDEALVTADGMIASMASFGIERAALIAPMTPDLSFTPMLRLGAPLMRRGIVSRVRGFRRAVRGIYGSWVRADGHVEVGGKRYAVISQPDNEAICRVVSEHRSHFVGWIFVNPKSDVRPTDEIERCAATPGMFGVKCHPFWHDCPIELLDDAAALCEERSMPMLIHLGTGPAGDFKRLPRRFPRLRVLYAHAGVPYGPSVWELARESKNVYVDLSSPGYVDARIAKKTVLRAGADKCLFGSDGPYFHHVGDRMDYGPALGIFEGVGLSGADRTRVARDNFLELVG
jgi:uncharacterized protein